MLKELTEDDLIDAANIGQAAREFMESDAGKSLIAAAEQEALEALERMGDLDPDREATQIRQCQIELKAARMFKAKLMLLVDIGENALEVWRQQNPERGKDGT